MHTAPISPRLALYGSPPVAEDAMIFFLAQAAKEARVREGVKPARIAVAIDIDPATIYRFERGQWPRDADFILTAYSAELDVKARELWRRALELWTQTDPGSE